MSERATGPGARGAGEGSPWPERAALSFVALSLLLLLITPVVVARQTAAIRERLEHVADPVQDGVRELQFNLAREMAALRGYLMTGDTTFLARYHALAGRQEESLRALEPLARQLGLEVETALMDVRARSTRWHERASPGRPGLVQPDGQAGLPPVDQRLFEETLAAASALDDAVTVATRALREEIAERERRALIVVLILAALALGSAGVLFWFGRRLRVLAAEAERQRHEAELALAETRRAAEARDRLVRGVTHDVKNPLGAAVGYAELLELGLRGGLSEGQRETVTGIRRSIESAVGIIDDLLELARAETGTLPVRLEDVVLNDLVASTLALHAGILEAAGMTARSALPDAPLVARTDARRVEQVLANLLSNAVKHSRAGRTVEVRLEQRCDEADARLGWAVIAVTDDGEGIPAEELERVFLEFHRLDPESGPGHGLGLSISRHIARQLGGDLTAEARHGRGARFALRLPLAGDRVSGATPQGVAS